MAKILLFSTMIHIKWEPTYYTVCSYHVTYAFQSESTLYSCLNVKELLARNRREIWSLSDCNWTRTHNHLVHKRTLNHLASGWVFVYKLSGCGFESICSHLLHSLQSRLITPFPTTNKRTKHGRKTYNSIKLYCICRMPYFKSDPDNDKGFFMICCSVCEEWYHKKCESVHSLIFKDETKAKNWRCRRCK